MIGLALWCLHTALAAPLSLDTVLDAVDARVPALTAAVASLEEAEGKLLAAQGAFDPALVGSGVQYTGPYPRQRLDTALVVPTALGPKLEAGYRRGVGDFPPYDGWNKTEEDGELRLGAKVPLLQGLGMGEYRAKMQDARFGLEGAEAGVEDIGIRVRRRAEESWWRWVGAGAKREIVLKLLDLAEARDRALTVQEREGSVARIQRLDNERVVAQRRAALAEANRELAATALALSLWYRDADGSPIVPADDDLPTLSDVIIDEVDLDEAKQQALSRPDVRMLLAELEQARVAVARGRNQVLPTLDAKVEARQDLTDQPTEWIVGADVDVPLLLRAGRGARDLATAKQTQVAAKLRELQDKIRADIEALWIARQAAAERVSWATVAADRADEVLTLERRSWELGRADLFVLLQREELLARHRRERVDAVVNHALVDIAFRASLGAL